MFEKNIVIHQGLEVKVTDHANEDILYVLDHSVQGSEGGLRFSLQNIARRIAAYKDRIRFVSLYKKNQITGTVGACFRISGQGKLRYPSTYIRYLAFQSSYQSDIGLEKTKQNPDKARKRRFFQAKNTGDIQ